MRLSNFLPTLTLLFYAVATFAQNASQTLKQDTSGIHPIEEVVITANRNKILRFMAPDPVNVVTGNSILNSQIRSTPESLILTPGVFVQKTTHGSGSAFIRGLTGNQTLLLIDGIRLSNATTRYGPNQYFNTIDIFSVDRIEVLRGSGSVQYGSDAIGGTIQAFSPGLAYSAQPSAKGTVIGRIATQDMEQSLRASTVYQGRNYALRGGVTFRNFGDLTGGDTTGVQSPSGYRELDFDLKGMIRLSGRSDLTLSFQRVHQNRVPIYHKIVLENYALNHFDPQQRNLAYIRLNHQINRGILKTVSLTGYYQHTLEGRISRKNGSAVVRTETDRVYSPGFTAEVLTSGGVWQASHGLEVYHDQVFSGRTDSDTTTQLFTEKRGLYPDGATMTSLALFTLHTLDFSRWILTAGARVNSYIINIEDQTLGSTRLTPYALVGNIALLRKLDSHSNLFVSLNTGFRAPNIDDLGTLGIVDFRYEIPNFDLKPEHSFQYQAGYKFHSRKLRGEFYLYRNELYNLIVRNRIEGEVIEGYPVYLKENMERAYIQGIETGWDFELNKHWSLAGTLTYTYGQNITRDEPMRRIPPLFGRVAASFTLKDLGLQGEWLTAGKQERLAEGDKADNRIPAGGTPGWNIFNIHASYSWRFISINLSLQNLLNEDYRYHGSGINGYGRSGLLTVKVSIGK